MVVSGCMHAQQHIELEEIVKKGGQFAGIPPAIFQAMPPKQQAMVKPPSGGIAMPPVNQAQPRPCAQGPRAQPGPYAQAHVQGPGPASYGQPSYGQPSYGQPSFGQPQQTVLQIRCGHCQQIFGSPQAGITVACPHCQTHNQVPAQAGIAGYGQAATQGNHGTYSQGGRNNGMMVAAGAGAGVLGGLVVADMLMG